ncbi:protein bag-of-marbles [Drosophila ficusphila]|uniref:protein bag-of-marbles n=1 Tax=Drosophila ficusphila TaxID=30025 RepID=UPI0007E70F35|nr:protein bag-of-marbles [Drosophila ficusphila]
MFSANSMDFSSNDERQLNNNLREMQQKLSHLLDSNENLAETASSSVSEDWSLQKEPPCVLTEVQRNLAVLKLDDNAPRFEFHGLGCVQQFTKRICKSGWFGAPPKKHLVCGQKQEQLQRENIWNKREVEKEISEHDISVEKLRSVGLHGNCLEHNGVLRLMDLFRSIHDHLIADLSFSRQNSMPSDYQFEMPVKHPMPKSLNIRYQLQVMCTKVERFLGQQRRCLETNSTFDYEKYTECDKLIKGSTSYLHSFTQFMSLEMRHRGGVFVNETCKSNAQRLENLLLGLREWLKACHLSVHVFNWAMDLEHRYSAAMTENHRLLNERAILLAAAEKKASKPRKFSPEEMRIAEAYQLVDLVVCVAEQEEFLNALLANPDTYFPPEVVAICGPRKFPGLDYSEDLDSTEESWEAEESESGEELASSPPRRYGREFLRFRS